MKICRLFYTFLFFDLMSRFTTSAICFWPDITIRENSYPNNLFGQVEIHDLATTEVKKKDPPLSESYSILP